jgi:hypothetical protein
MQLKRLQCELRESVAREAELMSRLTQRELELAALRDELEGVTDLRAQFDGGAAAEALPKATPRVAQPESPSQAAIISHGSAAAARVVASRVASLSKRWAGARRRLVEVACGQRDTQRCLAVLHGWVRLVWERRARAQAVHVRRLARGDPHATPHGALEAASTPCSANGCGDGRRELITLVTLEEQRQRLLGALHCAHVENRRHRE